MDNFIFNGRVFVEYARLIPIRDERERESIPSARIDVNRNSGKPVQ